MRISSLAASWNRIAHCCSHGSLAMAHDRMLCPVSPQHPHRWTLRFTPPSLSWPAPLSRLATAPGTSCATSSGAGGSRHAPVGGTRRRAPTRSRPSGRQKVRDRRRGGLAAHLYPRRARTDAGHGETPQYATPSWPASSAPSPWPACWGASGGGAESSLTASVPQRLHRDDGLVAVRVVLDGLNQQADGGVIREHVADHPINQCLRR